VKDQSLPDRVKCVLRCYLTNMSGAVNGPEQPQSVLKVHQLRRVVTTQQDRGRVILASISFEVASGEILFVTGKRIAGRCALRRWETMCKVLMHAPITCACRAKRSRQEPVAASSGIVRSH
jgi:ABC-type protease/lipase transport system fused ATPase/permease subunit